LVGAERLIPLSPPWQACFSNFFIFLRTITICICLITRILYNIMKLFFLLSLPLLTLLASCSSTPTSRIEKHPDLYRDLSPSHQKLVSEGRIAKGMTKPGVFLALGNPDRKIDGNKDGKSYQRWDYSVLTPVYRGGFSSYYGYGRGFYGRGGSRYGIGYSPSIHYVPRRGSSVNFSNEKVTGWSVVRHNY